MHSKSNCYNYKELVKPLSQFKAAKSNEILTEGESIISNWINSLTNLSTALLNPLENYTNEKFSSDIVKKLFSPDSSDEKLKKFEDEIKKLFPEATPEQTAWDNLTKLVERIKIVEECQITYENSLLVFNRATELGKAYVEARDEILESLYDKIKDRFVELYKEMHGTMKKDLMQVLRHRIQD